MWPPKRPTPESGPGSARGCVWRSRPVGASLLARVRGRGAARVPANGHRGAIVPTGMAVMALNAATLVRIRSVSTRLVSGSGHAWSADGACHAVKSIDARPA
jgi:hypothetical protein